jgi:His-Xaa-Ser system protein HxsD
VGACRELGFDKNAASLDSIKRAAYRFIDKFSTEFLIEGSTIKTVLRFGASVSEDDADVVVEEFRKEVLDQDLRASVRGRD